jgi:ABC-2 type transport system ATP-binding protein
MNVLETHQLGKRYRRSWALRECTLAVPAGRVVALAGPNGAGKTTLLHLAVGLATPSAGTVSVLGGAPAGCAAARQRIGFVAQDAALYRSFSVADTLRLAGTMNRGWDGAAARTRLTDLGIPMDRKVGQLSGGQQAQVALAVALAKRPELLILDEPAAKLDPLARHEFWSVLMGAVADDGLSVVLSSHVIGELERVCDYLIVLSAGNVQVAGEIEDLLSDHRLLTGPVEEATDLAARLSVVRETRAARQAHLLVRGPGVQPAGWQAHPVGLEELVLSYLREPTAGVLPGPSAVPASAAGGTP